MFRHSLIAVFLALGLVSLDISIAQADEWEDVGDIDGVQVQRKDVSGSSLVAFRGDRVVDVHIGKIMTIFTDPDERKNWVDRYDDSRTLARTETTETYWIRFGLSFPIKDRDYVLKAELDIDEDGRVITTNINSVRDRRMREQDCCVRAETQTYYRFEAIPGEERTRMRVEVHTDPKGRLPTALVNRIQRGWPSGTINGLSERAAQPGVEIHPAFEDWHEE